MNTDPLVVTLRHPRSERDPLPTPPRHAEKPKRRILPWIMLLLLMIAAGGGAYYFWTDLSGMWPVGNVAPATQEDQKSPEEVAAVVTSLVEEVGKLIVLPEGEEPTIATVSDPEKLKDQLFFANAKLGDKVLLYTEAKKAYLYDPVAKKLIEVAPITTELQ